MKSSVSIINNINTSSHIVETENQHRYSGNTENPDNFPNQIKEVHQRPYSAGPSTVNANQANLLNRINNKIKDIMNTVSKITPRTEDAHTNSAIVADSMAIDKSARITELKKSISGQQTNTIKPLLDVDLVPLGKGPVKPKAAADRLSTWLFDYYAGGKQIPKFSFHFSQTEDLIRKLEPFIPVIGNLVTSNRAHAKEFVEGICFGLSTRFMLEERAAIGRGKAYVSWLVDIINERVSTLSKSVNGFDSAYGIHNVHYTDNIDKIQNILKDRYRQDHFVDALHDLLSLQNTQRLYIDSLNEMGKLTICEMVNKNKEANRQFSYKLQANGLTNPDYESKKQDGWTKPDTDFQLKSSGYENFMETLRNTDTQGHWNGNKYISFQSPAHAMAIVISQQVTAEGKRNYWSFFDSNYGCQSFDNYDDFRKFVDGSQKAYIIRNKYGKSTTSGQSFQVEYNTFIEAPFSAYHNTNDWMHARHNEQCYVISNLQELDRSFTFGNNTTVKVVDFLSQFGPDGKKDVSSVTVEMTFKMPDTAKKVVTIEVLASNLNQVTDALRHCLSDIIGQENNSSWRMVLAEDAPMLIRHEI